MERRIKNIAIKNDNKKQSLLNAINNQIIHFNNNRYNINLPLSLNKNKSIGISKSRKLKMYDNKKSKFQKYFYPRKYDQIHPFKSNNLNYDISKYKSIIYNNNFKHSNKTKKINLGNESHKNEKLEIKNTEKIEEDKKNIINDNAFILNDFVYYVVHNNNHDNIHGLNQPLQFKCASLLLLDDQKDNINERNKLIEKPLDDLNDLDKENQNCYICQKKYALEEDIIILPCSHYFHKSCIFGWFEKYSTCPICFLDLNHL